MQRAALTMQQSRCNRRNLQRAAARTPRAARRTAPHDHSTEKAARCILSERCNTQRQTQHATCPLQSATCDTRHATAAATNEGLITQQSRRPRAPVMRTEIQANGRKKDKQRPMLPAGSMNPKSRYVNYRNELNMLELIASQEMRKFIEGASTHVALCAPCHIQHTICKRARCNTQHATCTIPTPALR
jgi:hypothetical protein